MSVPAGLMQALQQGGGASAPGGPAGPGAGAPPPSITLPGGPPGGAGATSDGDWEQDLQDALSALRKLAADATDHIETNVVDKCIAALSALTATRQKGAESALGVNAGHKAMSRAY